MAHILIVDDEKNTLNLKDMRLQKPKTAWKLSISAMTMTLI